MTAADTARQAAPAEANAAQTRDLAAALRRAAAEVAETAGGGIALLFAAVPGQTGLEEAARLRAAAGFASPAEARAAARSLAPHVLEVLESGAPQAPGLALGERAAAGLEIHPLAFGGRILGALAAGFPDRFDAEARAAVSGCAELVAARLEHAHLASEVAAARGELARHASAGEERNEEILKLSEALFAQDIELLRSSEKLGKIEKLKNDFIEKMSRELRTPLNSIIEAIISVLTGEDSLSESTKAILRKALDEGTAFLRTLQNILDLWRIKQGELPVELQDVNFREVVDEAIFSVQDAIGDKPVRVEPRLAEPFPKFRADLGKLSQVLFLLLENAAKFTEHGCIEIRAELDTDMLVCEVQDSGIGICQDDLQFVFDEFYQVDEPASDRYRGAGLGLALVRDLMILLEGDVSIASEIGEGTTVRFELPVQRLA